ncbi:MAG: two-component regulator propeller domain-containing protein [Bacteroidota bacterium]
MCLSPRQLPLLVTLLVGAVLAPDAPAQPSRLAGGAPLRFERLTVDDGLSQGDINDVLQDRQGFLWIATDAGLNRYDGYGFRVYRPTPFDATSLADEVVRTLFEDPDGSLWVGTTYARVCRLDRRTDAFTCLGPVADEPASLPDGVVNAVLRTRDGTLWVGGSAGLLRLDSMDDGGRFTRFTHDPADPTSLGDAYVTALHEDDAGHLWVSTFNGLHRLGSMDEGERFTHFLRSDRGEPTLSDRVYAVTPDATDARVWWVGSGDGLLRFDTWTGSAERFRPNPSVGPARNTVRRVATDPHDAAVLWVPIAGQGLARFDTRTQTFTRYPVRPDAPDGLVRFAGSTVFVDRFGMVWVGSDGGGLNRFDPSTGGVRYVGQATPSRLGLRNADVWGLHVTRDGALWAGTSGRLMHRIAVDDDGRPTDVRVWQATPRFAPLAADRPSGEPNDFVETRDGALWIATTNGLDRLDRATGTFRHVTTADGLPDDNTLTLRLDRNDVRTLWVGTEGGLVRVDAETQAVEQVYTHDPDDPASLADNWVSSLWQTTDDALWVGHERGVSRLDVSGGTFTHHLHDPADPATVTSGTISALLERRTEPGVLWLGALGGGLDRLDLATGAVTHFTTANSELPDNAIYGLVEDRAGRLWMSTNRGLARLTIDGEQAGTAGVGALTFRRFGPASGVQEMEFNQYAIHADTDTGRFFFGGINGITWFAPEAIAYNALPPEVVLTGLRAANEPLRVTDDGPLRQPLAETTALTLPYRQRTVGIDYVGLHFKDPARNRYRIRLDGFDDGGGNDGDSTDGWSEPTTQRSATYTNLPAGSYTFRVQASNADGVWSDDARALRLTIQPPWWRSAFAYLAYAALLVAVVVLVDRIQRRRLLARVRERQREKERAHAREIEAAYHDLRQAKDRLVEQEKLASLGALTAGIAHEIKNPLNFITNFAEVNLDLADDLDAALQQGASTPETPSQLEQPNAEAAAIVADLRQTSESILQHGRRADGIIRAMMAHARQGHTERETVDLNALVAEHAGLAYHGRRARMPESGRPGFQVMLDEAYDPAVGSVDVVPQEIGRVVVNLVGNAFDAVADAATHRGATFAPRVRVSTEREGEHLAIRIADNGLGVSPTLRARIFEPFFTTKPTGSGTGLGLSMSYDIVVQGHGGTLSVEDDPGGGAAFVVRLPALPPTSTTTATLLASTVPPEP